MYTYIHTYIYRERYIDIDMYILLFAVDVTDVLGLHLQTQMRRTKTDHPSVTVSPVCRRFVSAGLPAVSCDERWAVWA